jgi:WD40 repeat protein
LTVGTPTLAATLARFAEARTIPPADPFRGIKPFRLADSGLLAAREDEIEQMTRLITMYRGVLLYGESGSGKTSLVNAGVVPRMLEAGFWPHRVRVPPDVGEFVLEPIQHSDADRNATVPSAFAGATDDGRLEIKADEFVDAVTAAAEHGRILLLFDQFEELVTLAPDSAGFSDAQTAIIDALIELLRGGQRNGSRGPVRAKLLFAFREDYLASLSPLFERYPDLVHQGLRLTPPPLDKATEIIREPFVRFEGHYPRELSQPLSERIAGELAVHAQRGELPLSVLQIVCDRLVREPDPDAALEDRKVEGLLEDYTEAALAKLGDLRAAAIEVLGRLITSSGTRNLVSRDGLVQRAGVDSPDSDPELAAALAVLGRDSGLIRREHRRVDLYELTSEFLIPWIHSQRERLRAERAAQEARLKAERKLRTLRLILVAAAIVLVVVFALAIVWWNAKNRAQHEQRVAQDVELASRAQQLLGIRPDASLILALDAYRGDHTDPQVQTSMIAALEQAELSGARGILHGSAGTVTSVAFDPTTGLLVSGSGDGTIRLWNTLTNTQMGMMGGGATTLDGVFSLAFGDHGRTLASGGADGSLRLWSVSSRRELGPPRQVQDRLVVSLAFSANGDRLAVAGLDGQIKLVTLDGPDKLGAISVLPGGDLIATKAVAFSPNDPNLLVSVGNDRNVRFWNLSTPANPIVVPIKVPLFAVSFNPADPAQLAVGGLNGIVYLMRVDSPRFTRFGSNASAVNSIAFTHDGRTFAAGHADDSIQLWNPDGSPTQRPVTLVGHEGPVTSVAFAPGTNMLASGSSDTTIRLWSTPPATKYGAPLAPKLAQIYSVAFGGNGQFAEAGSDGLRAWKVDGGIPTGNPVVMIPGSFRSAAFAPGAGTPAGGVLSAGLFDGTLEQLSRSEASPPSKIRAGGTLYAVAYSPDGRMFAYSGGTQPITVVDLRSGHSIGFPSQTQVYSLAFDPRSDILASSSDDRTIRLWKITDSRSEPAVSALGILTGDSDAVFSLAFNTTGMLASGSDDGTIRLWNVITRKEIGQPLLGDEGYVNSVAFSRDGDILASASNDGTVRLWDVASRSQIGLPFNASAGGIQTVAFSPHANDLIAGGDDGELRAWPVVRMPHSFAEAQHTVCATVGAGLNSKQWKALAPAGIADENPCQ